MNEVRELSGIASGKSSADRSTTFPHLVECPNGPLHGKSDVLHREEHSTITTPCGIRCDADAFVSGMKRMTRFASLLVFAAAIPLAAQQPAAPAPAPTDKVVATINGEVITQSQLDMIYDSLSLQM